MNMILFERRRYSGKISAFSAILLLGLLPSLNAATITIASSSSVTYLDSGNSSTDFSAPFTAANFAAAQTGTAASVLSSTPYWFPASDIAGAAWIGTNSSAGTSSGNTALYAASFSLPSAVSSASLTVSYGVDNALGDANAGIYINGTALSGSTGVPCGVGVACVGAFNGVNTYSAPIDPSLLSSGTNWIYFDGVNLGGPSGLIFSADVTYTPSTTPVPEPSTVIFTVLGSAAVVFCRKMFPGKSRRPA